MKTGLDRLLLHSETRSQLATFINRPANTLLISGPPGSGKKTIADNIAADLLSVDPQRVSQQAHIILINKPVDKSEIPIEAIRSLINKTNLRVADGQNRAINRVVIVQDSQFMSTESQNAMLKLLEEPPKSTLLILTADSQDNLLPTVVSRTQRINLVPPSLEDSMQYFDSHPKTTVESNWRLSRGGVGLLSALLDDETAHPLKLAVVQAKEFITRDTYHRLLQAQQLAKNKDEWRLFLDALGRVLSALHSEYITRGNQPAAKKILKTRNAVEAAHKQAAGNVNTRLASLALALNTSL